MFRTQEDQEAAIAAARYENSKKEMLAAAYAKNPLWVRCIASDKQIFEIFTMFAGHDATPSYELFRLALDENPDAVKMIAQQSEAITRRQLTEEVISLLQAHSRRDDHMLKAEENRLKHFSIEALRIRLAELKTKIHMVSEPVSVLKKFVADAHKDESFQGYPVLPKSMWNGNKHVNVDAAYLTNLIQTDMWQFKKLVKIYGSAQVDSRRGIR